MKRTLLAIALFVLFMLGTFVWFVATWDSTREDPVVRHAPPEHAYPVRSPRRAGFTPPTRQANVPYASQTQTIRQPAALT